MGASAGEQSDLTALRNHLARLQGDNSANGNGASSRLRRGPLAAQTSALEHRDHLCSFYASAEEQFSVVIPFFKEALRRGESCIYVAADRTEAEVSKALRGMGTDVERERRQGRLVFVSKWQWRLQADHQLEAMAANVRRIVEGVLSRGYSGAWVAVDMTWALDPDLEAADLFSWEKHWNELLATMPTVLLCQYNQWRISPAVLLSQLQTHPIAILGDQLYPNSFFEPPSVAAANGNGAP